MKKPKALPALLVFLLALSFFPQLAQAQLFGLSSRDVKFRAEGGGSVAQGGLATMSWTVPEGKASRIYFEGRADSLLPATGRHSLVLDEDLRVVLVVETGREPIRKYLNLKALKPELRSLVAPTLVNDEDDFELRWTSQDATWVELLGHPDTLPARGSMRTRLDRTQRLVMVAHNPHGRTDTASQMVGVHLLESPPQDILLALGQARHQRWTFKMTDSVALVGLGRFAATDSALLPADTTRLYRLVAYRQAAAPDTFPFKATVLRPGLLTYNCPEQIPQGSALTVSWTGQLLDSVVLTHPRGRYSLPESGSHRLQAYDKLVVKLEAYRGGELWASRETKVFTFAGRQPISGLVSYQNLDKAGRVDMQIIRVERENFPNRVSVRVVAVDQEGQFVSGLAPNATFAAQFFRGLTETVEGRVVPLRNFSVREVVELDTLPTDISVVLDYSGSMTNNAPIVEAALRALLQKQRFQGRLSFVCFDGRVGRSTPFSADPQVLLSQAPRNGIRDFGGSTALYAGADMGLRALEGSTRRKMLLILTDGWENSSMAHSDSLAFTATQVGRRARAMKATVCVIGIRGANIRALQNLASATDGYSFFAFDQKTLEGALLELLNRHERYYQLEYTPSASESAHDLSLIYNSLRDNAASSGYRYFIKDDVVIDEVPARELAQYYWGTPEVLDGKAPIAPPQAVAFFPTNGDQVEGIHRGFLLDQARRLAASPELEVVVLGHTDSQGGQEDNMDLALRRAESARDILVEGGFPPERVRVVAFGKSAPIWTPEDQPWKRDENRRVELLLLQP